MRVDHRPDSGLIRRRIERDLDRPAPSLTLERGNCRVIG
jgi:hypothetical protein